MAKQLRYTARIWRERRVPQCANVPKRAQAGFTLVEMLAAMAVLLLASAIVAAGVPAATQAYIAAVDNANAQVLLSTATTRLRDELSVADPSSIRSGDSLSNADQNRGVLIRFESLETGYNTAIVYDSGTDDDGDVWGLCLEQSVANPADVETEEGQPIKTRLVPKTAAAGANAGLSVKIGSITHMKGSHTVSVKNVTVVRPGGSPLARASIDEFDVKLISAQKIS